MPEQQQQPNSNFDMEETLADAALWFSKEKNFKEGAKELFGSIADQFDRYNEQIAKLTERIDELEKKCSNQ